ncbi:MAG: RDD family protein [Chloroflexota bacterium]
MKCTNCGAQVEPEDGFCPNCGAKQGAAVATIPVPPAADQPSPAATVPYPTGGSGLPEHPLRHKGVGPRLAAALVDSILHFVFAWLVAAQTGNTTDSGFDLQGAPAFLTFAAWGAYFVLFEGLLGGTVGKLILGMRVVNGRGERPGLGAALLRNLLRIVDFLPLFYLLGAILVMTSKQRQRLGDRVAGTFVVAVGHDTPRADPKEVTIRSAPPTSKEGTDREVLLKAIEEDLSRYPQLQLFRGSKSDLEIKSVMAGAHWGPDKKKVEYSASLLAREAERTVVYWEMVKETGRGMGFLAGFKVETYRSNGKTISGQVREVKWSPAGKAVDYRWDYAQTRTLVEQVATAHGWKFTTTMRKGKAER